MTDSTSVKRPFSVYVLAILAGLVLVACILHVFQAMGVIPYFIGPFSFRAFDFFNFLMWLIMVWIFAWLITMIWNMDPQAWIFLAVISIVNLTIDFVMMFGATQWSDIAIDFMLNALILIFVMLPSVRKTFKQG
jgi:drug/metabolite transporter (DMT)-like permease